jgi:cytochrome c biogenesis protein CcdA
MLRLIGLVVAIGLADSVNPTTVGPALVLAGGERGRGRVAEFTFAVFAVYLVGGAAIALGPGHVVLSLLPHPRGGGAHVLEIVAGAALLGIAVVVWSHRRRLPRSGHRAGHPRRRSSAILGATISAVELPTAFPYFVAIAAIAGSGVGTSRQIALLVLFNVCFVLPLVGIIGLLSVSGRAASILSRGRQWLQARWPAVLAGAAFLAGVLVVTVGVAGLSGQADFARFV